MRKTTTNCCTEFVMRTNKNVVLCPLGKSATIHKCHQEGMTMLDKSANIMRRTKHHASYLKVTSAVTESMVTTALLGLLTALRHRADTVLDKEQKPYKEESDTALLSPA